MRNSWAGEDGGYQRDTTRLLQAEKFQFNTNNNKNSHQIVKAHSVLGPRE